MRNKWIFWVLRGVLFGTLFIAAIGLAVMLLWNALVPQLFGLASLNFGQAIGLLVLSQILFRGFGGWGRWGGHRSYRKKWAEKWETMTPEEQGKFRAEWEARCNPKKSQETPATLA